MAMYKDMTDRYKFDVFHHNLWFDNIDNVFSYSYVFYTYSKAFKFIITFIFSDNIKIDNVFFRGCLLYVS